MRVFARVADLGSFSAAAESLGLSRAMVSTRVAALEKRCGVRLLDRTTRRASLTSEGARFLERCRHVFSALQAAEDELGNASEQPGGRLRVEFPGALGRQILIPALPRFRDRFPELEVEVRLGDRIADFRAERIDVAVRGGTITGPGLVARRAASSRWITCASPGYLERRGWPQATADLCNHQLIGYLGAGKPHSWIFRQGRLQASLDPVCGLAFDDPEAVLAAALQGAGIVQTMDLLAEPALRNRQLVVLLPGTAVRGPPVSVIHQQDGDRLPGVRLFVEFMVELLRKHQRSAATVTGLMDAP